MNIVGVGLTNQRKEIQRSGVGYALNVVNQIIMENKSVQVTNKPNIKYAVNVVIPETCMNPDGDEKCQCYVEPSKQEKNPV